MSEVPHIENGFASVTGGSWLMRRGQPAAAFGAVQVRGLKGFIVPDRMKVQVVEAQGAVHAAVATQPFLTQVSVVGEQSLSVVSEKLLVAPSEARVAGRLVRVIPMSFRQAIVVTQLGSEWAVLATRSRVKRLVLEEGEVVTVRSEAVVAWTGKDPTGFVPKLRLRDVFLPVRRPVAMSLHFYGPQVVWTEGCDAV